jgi:hypothetical protein
MARSGVVGRVLKKVRRLWKPLQSAASVVWAWFGWMFMASRIQVRASPVIEPAFSMMT